MALSNSEIYRHKAVLKSEKSFSSNIVVLSVGIVAVHPYRQYISLTNGLIRQHKCSLIKFNTPAMFVVILKPSILDDSQKASTGHFRVARTEFQTEAKCEATDMKMSFHFHA